MPTPIVSGYAGLADVRIYYEVYGQGPPVVVLHGNGEDLHAFDDMIFHLKGTRRVIALDTRGHGKSGRGKQPMNFETLSRDVAAVMGELRIDSAPLVGYSDGASTAMYLALRCPQRVSGLVLLGANMCPRGIKPRYQIPIEMGHFICGAVAKWNRGAVKNLEILELMVRHPNLTPEKIAAIKCPALVIAGERDMVKRAHTEAIARALGGAKPVILAGESHFDIVKSPRAFAAIAAFLTAPLPGA